MWENPNYYLGYNNQRYEYTLDRTNVVPSASCRDLGIMISDDLKFSTHCKKVSKNAHYRRRQLQQAFASRDRKLLVELYCTYIRPIIESSSVVWSPHGIGDINLIEDVQRKFTKYLPGLYNLNYTDRLLILEMESL